MVREEYLQAVIDGADCAPVLIPAFGDLYDVDDLIGALRWPDADREPEQRRTAAL